MSSVTHKLTLLYITYNHYRFSEMLPKFTTKPVRCITAQRNRFVQYLLPVVLFTFCQKILIHKLFLPSYVIKIFNVLQLNIIYI